VEGVKQRRPPAVRRGEPDNAAARTVFEDDSVRDWGGDALRSPGGWGRAGDSIIYSWSVHEEGVQGPRRWGGFWGNRRRGRL